MKRTQRSGKMLEKPLMDLECKSENCVGGTGWAHMYVLVVNASWTHVPCERLFSKTRYFAMCTKPFNNQHYLVQIGASYPKPYFRAQQYYYIYIILTPPYVFYSSADVR